MNDLLVVVGLNLPKHALEVSRQKKRHESCSKDMRPVTMGQMFNGLIIHRAVGLTGIAASDMLFGDTYVLIRYILESRAIVPRTL